MEKEVNVQDLKCEHTYHVVFERLGSKVFEFTAMIFNIVLLEGAVDEVVFDSMMRLYDFTGFRFYEV